MEKIEIIESVEVLGVLLSGKHPSTGEVLAADDSANSVEVMRSLALIVGWFSARHTRKRKLSTEQKRENNMNSGYPEFYGLPWDETSAEKTATLFRSGKKPHEIGEELGRSTGAVITKLRSMDLWIEQV